MVAIAKSDEFERIKNITECEMQAMHHMQLGLSDIIPQNTGGFGDLQKSMEVYHELEVMAMQQVFLGLNEQVGGKPVAFREPDWKRDLQVE